MANKGKVYIGSVNFSRGFGPGRAEANSFVVFDPDGNQNPSVSAPPPVEFDAHDDPQDIRKKLAESFRTQLADWPVVVYFFGSNERF